MKVINFSVKEILPSLLDKSKVQTIRPAWKQLDYIDTGEHTLYGYKNIYENIVVKGRHYKIKDFEKGILEKPPRFKVGETVKITIEL